MIDRSLGEFDISCDFCSYEESVDTDGDFHEMIDIIKQKGWRIFNDKGEWKHKCPSCVETSQQSVYPTETTGR